MTHLRTAILSLGLLLSGCHPGFFGEAPQTSPPILSIEGDRVVVQPESRFMKRLNSITVQSLPGTRFSLQAVGQMLALANPSGALSGPKISWVELDPDISQSVGLNLSSFSGSEIGTAFGAVAVSSEYEGQIALGERVVIARYGLKRSKTSGSVVFAHPSRSGAIDSMDVVFRVADGSEWYPGTNCEITFPLHRSIPVKIPTTALLHEGAREYVLKEVAPAQFSAVNVSITEETPDQAMVLGLNSGDRIIGVGAILLKPELHFLLSGLASQSSEKGRSHAP
jgi:hypothetical protein